MGCDIHAYKEVKIRGEWHCFGESPISRRYGVFGVMAGVRGGESKFPVKGLPKDVTEPVRALAEKWGTDGHHHSYLTSIELAQLKKVFEKWESDVPETERLLSGQSWYFKEFGRIGWTYILDFITEKIDGEVSDRWIEDVRLVFWFDN